jgi:hypothetical protein
MGVGVGGGWGCARLSERLRLEDRAREEVKALDKRHLELGNGDDDGRVLDDPPTVASLVLSHLHAQHVVAVVTVVRLMVLCEVRGVLPGKHLHSVDSTKAVGRNTVD